MPVDIAFGTAKLEYEDVAVPGKVPLTWDRRYSTALLQKPHSVLGHGWTCRYFATLQYVDGRYEFVTPDGGTEIFPDPSGVVAKGRVVRNLSAFLEVFRDGSRCIVRSWNVETGDIKRYCFDPTSGNQPWKLASIEDVTGQGNDLVWDGSGRLQAVRQRLEQRELGIAYNKSGYIERVFLDAGGARHTIMTYAYDDAGRQIEARDAAKFADRFEYDVDGRVTREIVRDGGVFHYRYDDRGRCVVRTGLGHYTEKRLRFIDSIRVTEVTDSYGLKSMYHHLPSGQTVQEIDPLGSKRNTEYDQYGRIIAKTDPSGATTRYVFDDQGNRSSVIDALGNSVTFTFNTHHQSLSMTDADGQLWQRGYDATNRLIGTMDPLGNRWLFRYDTEGNVAEVINPKGSRKHQVHNGGILQSTTDWMGNPIHFGFDAFGRVIERKGALGEVTRFRYDAMGNPIEAMLPDGTTVAATYDHAGNLIRFVDANGNVSRWRYGPCMRLLDRTDATGNTVRYVWGTELGRLEQIVNENEEIYRFFYDDAGHVVREQSFDGCERQFRYDASGHVIAYTNGCAETIKVTRDAMHRITCHSFPGGEAKYEYDRRGTLIAAVNSDVAVAFERDPCGRIVRESQVDRWVASRYDELGNLTGTETSFGHRVDYNVDANGHATALSTRDHECAFERDAYGNEIARKMPGALLKQHYDLVGRLVEQTVTPRRMLGGGRDGTTTEQHANVRRKYVYDRNSSVMSIEDDRWGRVEYSYDPAERLLQALRQQGPSESFSYDRTGNVTRMMVKGESEETLIYDRGNRLIRKGTTCYEYDAEGRRTRMTREADGGEPQFWKYEWDAQDRLRCVTRPDGRVWRYQYDALGRRVAKIWEGGQSLYVWDKDVLIHQADDAGPLSSWVFDAHSFVPIATLQGDRAYSIVSDHLGTPKELIDSNGDVAWSALLSSWGKGVAEAREDDASGNCQVRYQGQWRDDETGLHYNRFRYFDPESMAYISQDPNRVEAGTNLYAYGKNPCNFIDPTGLCAASDLPPLKGKHEDEVRQILAAAGFTQTHVGGNAARNETWSHADGSEVRIHPYGNQNQAPYRSANNAHVHKESSSGQQLTDAGIPSTNPADTHIGIPNPPDLPTVRGRPHGAGTQ